MANAGILIYHIHGKVSIFISNVVMAVCNQDVIMINKWQVLQHFIRHRYNERTPINIFLACWPQVERMYYLSYGLV